MSIKTMSVDAQNTVRLVLIIAIGLIILGKFGEMSGITSAANDAINLGITSIDDFIDWVTLIVLFVVVAYLFSKKKGQGANAIGG